jgi:hypothetical protein
MVRGVSAPPVEEAGQLTVSRRGEAVHDADELGVIRAMAVPVERRRRRWATP